MTAQPEPDPGEAYQVIRLGGQEAAIVPLTDLRRLQAVERLATAEVIESADIETTLGPGRGLAGRVVSEADRWRIAAGLG